MIKKKKNYIMIKKPVCTRYKGDMLLLISVLYK